MKKTREQKRAEMRAAAEALIEELLEWDETVEEPTLTQIEDEVLLLRERFGQRLAEMVLGGQEKIQLVEVPLCSGCGERMRYKGRKRIAPESRLGALRLERGYYHCARCEGGIFPPGLPTWAA